MPSRLVRLLRPLRLEHRVALRGLAERVGAVLTAPLRLAVSRDPTLVALGCNRDRFADNAAHLFLHLSRAGDPLVRPVWVTGSRELVDRLRGLGHRAELRWSPGGVRVALRAGAYVYSSFPSDINPVLGRGATTVCLWHGIPLKRIERDLLPRGKDAGARLAASLRRPPPDYLLSSTELVSRRCLMSAFGVPLERCWHHGYPRNDLLVRPPARPDPAFGADRTWEALQVPGPVVGLFLTWRDGRPADLADSSLVLELAETCSRHGATLVYKPHYNVLGPVVDHPSVVVLPARSDLNVHLASCDVLITDYSAVVFDALLTGLPVLRYVPDLLTYRRSRGFCLDPDTLPGPACPDRDTLLAALDDLLGRPPERYADERGRALRQAVWGGYAGQACADVAASLRTLALSARPGRARLTGPTARAHGPGPTRRPDE